MTRLVADWLDSPAAQAVAGALEAAGHQALFVGGCVRNALLGAPVADLDVATDARPEAVHAIADAAGLRAVPTGIDHGTITVIHETVPIEVTTFRHDVETFGRHATVRFSTDVAEDARRRDFTMNALYADVRGVIQDPVGEGLADLAARRLRFVGDADARVKEDFLRILRFFRFHAWYADPDGGMDSEALAACAAGAEGLDHISEERLGAEMKKLLSAPDPSFALAAMAQTGVLAHVLPAADPAPVARLIHLSPEPDPVLRLAALGGNDVADRLRLSRAEARRRESLLKAARSDAGAAELAWRHDAAEARAMVSLRAALTAMPLADGLADALDAGARAAFPIRPQDLMPAYEGPALGARLGQLERAWLATGMTASRDHLLALPDE
ncbi:MAG: CCA tRNA nucleotidyltransferase [Pseudomonadota bacterium]